MNTEQKDQLDLFADRGKRKIRYFCILFFAFIFFGIFIMLALSGGKIEGYEDSYIALVALLGIYLVLMLVLHCAVAWRLRKEKQKFTREELNRINREAAKAPRLEHILVTHDLIAYHLGMRVILIPVKDIVWMREWETTKIHTYHAAGISTMNAEKYINIRTRDGKSYHILNQVKSDEVWDFLLTMVLERRPGVIVGGDEKWEKITKTEYQEAVNKVDAEGTVDPADLEMMYHIERNYSLYHSDIGNSRPSEIKLMIFIMGTFLVSIFLFQLSGMYIKHSDPVKQELLIRMWKGFGIGAILVLPVIVTMVSFFKNVIFDKERIASGMDMLIYAFFALITVGPLLGYGMMAQEQIRPVEAVSEWKSYVSGKSDTLKVSGAGNQSKKGRQKIQEYEDHWTYGDDTFEKHPEVYGYDTLSKEEQADFDLLYSDILTEGVDSIREIDLPYPADRDMFDKINALYQCNRKFNLYQKYGYLAEEVDGVLKTYAVINYQKEDIRNEYSDLYQKKAKEIAAQIPEKLNDEEKIKWIVDYLVGQVAIYSQAEWMEATDHGKITDTLEYERGIQSDTGYGALVLNMASEQGFMEAFGMIAKKAGIYSIAAINERTRRYWNLVFLDGKWKAVDVYAVAKLPEKREQYYLVSNAEMERRLLVSGSYGGNPAIMLPE